MNQYFLPDGSPVLNAEQWVETYAPNDHESFRSSLRYAYEAGQESIKNATTPTPTNTASALADALREALQLNESILASSDRPQIMSVLDKQKRLLQAALAQHDAQQSVYDDITSFARIIVADVLEHEEAAWSLVEDRIRQFVAQQHDAQQREQSEDSALRRYLRGRRLTIESSIMSEALAGNDFKLACETTALAEITALECELAREATRNQSDGGAR